MFPDRLLRVVQLLSRLPGVGEKTAQRYALMLAAGDEAIARDLGRELLELRDWVEPCARCGHIAEKPRSGGSTEAICGICRDPKRDATMLCVVSRVQDLMAIEKSGAMRGRYFVLRRLLSPLDGVGREEIGVDRLLDRIRAADPKIAEVVVATPPSVDGEATALLLAREIGALSSAGSPEIQVTRIASGVPHGGDLEFADQVTLGRAMEHRRRFLAS
jgi:recombination protein RecR